jgi:hypothetical protein
MSLNSGINPELILLHFGVDFYYGRNQALKKVMNILKINIYNIIYIK